MIVGRAGDDGSLGYERGGCAYAFGLACACEDALDHLLLLAEEVDHLRQTNSSREPSHVSDEKRA